MGINLESSPKSRPYFCARYMCAITTGVIGWWPGDGNSQDIIGGNHGTLINGTTFASSQVAEAFSFDGIDDGLLVSDAPILNFGEGADFSLDAWIRFTPGAPVPPTNHITIVSKRYAPTASAKPTGFELFLINGSLGVQLADESSDNGNYRNFIANSSNLLDGNFHHVAVTIDRDMDNGGHLYVDGQDVHTFNTHSESGDLSTTEPLRIGIHASSDFDAFLTALLTKSASSIERSPRRRLAPFMMPVLLANARLLLSLAVLSKPTSLRRNVTLWLLFTTAPMVLTGPAMLIGP